MSDLHKHFLPQAGLVVNQNLSANTAVSFRLDVVFTAAKMVEADCSKYTVQIGTSDGNIVFSGLITLKCLG